MAIAIDGCNASLGALVIDWKNRKYEFIGMDGDDDEMTIEQVGDVLVEHADDSDKEAMVLVFWHNNDQLAVHDDMSFAGDPARDEDDGEVCDECGAVIPDDAPDMVNNHHKESCSLHPSAVT